MFDIGWPELFLIGVVALIVIGPKDLPVAMRAAAKFFSKLRGLSQEFQSSVAEVMREAELDELRRKVERASRMDPANAVKSVVDPTGSLSADFDPAEFAGKLKQTVEGGPPTAPATPTAPDAPVMGPSLPASSPAAPPAPPPADADAAKPPARAEAPGPTDPNNG